MIKKVKDIFSSKEMVFYLLGGITAFLLDFGLLNVQVYILSFELTIFEIIFVPNIISATIAVIFNFYIQKYHAFESHDKSKTTSELTKFVGVQISNVFFFGGLVFGIILNAGISVPVTKIMTMILQMISSYFLYKFVVFKKENAIR